MLASLRRLNNPGYTCTLNTDLDERKGQERRCYTKDLSTAQVLRTGLITRYPISRLLVRRGFINS
jgi:hypothetical protein